MEELRGKLLLASNMEVSLFQLYSVVVIMSIYVLTKCVCIYIYTYILVLTM